MGAETSRTFFAISMFIQVYNLNNESYNRIEDLSSLKKCSCPLHLWNRTVSDFVGSQKSWLRFPCTNISIRQEPRPSWPLQSTPVNININRRWQRSGKHHIIKLKPKKEVLLSKYANLQSIIERRGPNVSVKKAWSFRAISKKGEGVGELTRGVLSTFIH